MVDLHLSDCVNTTSAADRISATPASFSQPQEQIQQDLRAPRVSVLDHMTKIYDVTYVLQHLNWSLSFTSASHSLIGVTIASIPLSCGEGSSCIGSRCFGERTIAASEHSIAFYA